MSAYEPFGQVAIKLGFVTPGQLESALDIQKSLERSGKGRKLLGMIFLETGMISSAQLIEILQYYQQRQTPQGLEPDGQSSTS